MKYKKCNFHNKNMKENFFEGWYFKHTFDNKVYCFIPGVSIDEDNVQTFFLQVIGDFGSRFITYQEDECYFDQKKMLIKMGDSMFSDNGAKINIQKNGLSIKGSLKYGKFTKLKDSLYAPSIMGPFSYLKFLECYHDIISLKHTVVGNLKINGKDIICKTGTGYIEKDWGTSMPKSWLWLKCNEFQNDKDASLMISLALVPLKRITIKGIIVVFHMDKKQYRLATYYGAKSSVKTREDGMVYIRITQGKVSLLVKVKPNCPVELKAPVNGRMKRTIVEYTSCKCEVRLIYNGKLVFKSNGKNAGYEKVSFGYHPQPSSLRA